MPAESQSPRTAEAIAAATGIAWPDWAAWVDAHGGRDLTHAGIAELAHARMSADTGHAVENAGWWSQSVAVAYEQQIGRRLPGQRQDGTFYVSVNRTVPVDPVAAMAAWQAYVADSDELGGFALAGPARTSTTPKRLYWRAACTDGSTLQLAVEPRPAGSQLTMTQEVLPNPGAREESRQVWKAVLAGIVFP